MLVLGDSILWGQGLTEKNKISYKVQEWLCKETGRLVKVWREAHSGAVIKEGIYEDHERGDGGDDPGREHDPPTHPVRCRARRERDERRTTLAFHPATTLLG